ncbi:MscS Mechanosensitive ion channel protein [Halorhabdus tiamatea SARL4B]|uniref:MscS Mechanosensitive ion channel protein n=1 Tax=Halorhabdus tiamatea SARL4B TaxID=1033806 RepID=F7PI86_9EURY|nr:mechanosensitive ion channel family protein [Halorhabdus tiamatea]ERJ05261.1 MscS Mechanosensitive ion channel protein [Halorhabdus tiamatea SARL4B]CCQ32168.1 potassium efflux system KefA protein / small-conductance mechanosensitive channel MscS [Halorhabdus tiamatea SARL4B]
MVAIASAFSQMQGFFSGLSTVEWRLAVSVAVAVGALVVSTVLVPFAARQFRRGVRTHILPGPLGTGVDVVDESLPTTVGWVAVRLLQLSIVALAVLALLTIWDLLGVVESIVDSSGLSRWVVIQLFLTFALAGVVYVVADQYKRVIVRIGTQATWMTDHQLEIVVRIGQIVILLFGGLIGMGLWGINPQGLLVGAGFLGIVVGLAARQTLGALIAGIVLMFSRPFEIGDWVQIGEEEGIVTDIAIMNTRLENFDGEVVYLPNDRVNERAIVNRSRRGSLRLRVDVGIDYDSEPEHAKTVALTAIKEIDVVADGPPPQIVPKSFGDSAVVLEMRFWIDHPTPPRKWNAVERVVTAVKTAFEREGIKIPYPQRELSGRAETDGFRVHESGGVDDAGTQN